MALEIFRSISNLRMVLDSETDADSPDNETSYKGIREMIEDLYQLMLGTNEVGTATSIAETILTDTGAAIDVDEHNGRTLVICSGNAKGNFYTIDDTAATTITCTGDTLVSDGVEVGDDYIVLYDIKTNLDGHDHDGSNSKEVVLADDQVVAEIADDACNLEKIEKGSVMLPYYMSIEATEFTTSSTSYDDYTYSFYVYIPANATSITMASRIKASEVAANVSCVFDIGTASSANTTAETSYTWYNAAIKDVSALSGWQVMKVQLKVDNGAHTGYLQGFSFYWE